jgi:hypothetical protein
MRQNLQSLVLLGLIVGLSIKHGSADELVPCVNDGIELRRDFIVSVKHEGKPLSGVKIEITRGRRTFDTGIVKSSFTGSDGLASITVLPPGQYWLSAEMLGISAAYHCFHVGEKPSRRAKRFIVYQWGYGAPLIRRAAGKLVDTQPGNSDNPLWNALHPIDVPIGGATLRLTDARTGQVFTTTSDDRGEFAFAPLPDGTYILHSEGGRPGRPYEPTDLLLKISSRAKTSGLALRRGNPSALGAASLNFYWDAPPQFR